MSFLSNVGSWSGRVRQWLPKRGGNSVPPMDENSVIKLLIIGGTGQGKSTLINYILSFSLNKPMTNPAIAIPTPYHSIPNVCGNQNSERDKSDQTTSKTKHCTNYDVFVGGSIRKWFRFIDTPGLNDTNGNDQDVANQAEIYRGVVETKNLGAIIIVVNGTKTRCTSDFKACLARLENSMPDFILRNLIFVVSCSNAYSCNFDLDSLKPLVASKDKTFYMNNSAFSSDPATWGEMSRSERNILQNEWKMSMQTIKNILSMVAELVEMQQLANDLECWKVAKQSNEEPIEQNKNYKETVEIDETNFEKNELQEYTRCHLHPDVVCHRKFYGWV